MTDPRRALVLMVVLACTLWVAASAKTVKETLVSGGASRAYYLFVPDGVFDKPRPLVVLLHGSGRDGKSLLTYWENLAKSEGIIVAAPDAAVREGWGMREDGPHFLYDLIEAVKRKQPVDSRRVYLFGHSAGALHALAMAVLESEYFAAVAVHAGVLDTPFAPFIERAPRKIPIAMWIGTRDALFPIAAVRRTRDEFNSHGFDVQLTEIPGHTHRYYDRGAEINRDVWTFLKDKQLPGEPKYQQYEIPK